MPTSASGSSARIRFVQARRCRSRLQARRARVQRLGQTARLAERFRKARRPFRQRRRDAAREDDAGDAEQNRGHAAGAQRSDFDRKRFAASARCRERTRADSLLGCSSYGVLRRVASGRPGRDACAKPRAECFHSLVAACCLIGGNVHSPSGAPIARAARDATRTRRARRLRPTQKGTSRSQLPRRSVRPDGGRARVRRR